tara:strand:+ start:253 stop:741 length:489 start_codon:yes stop_codon:yes gene_type:complete
MNNYSILISIAIFIFILSLSLLLFLIFRSEMQKVKKNKENKDIYKEYEEPIITYPSNNNNTLNNPNYNETSFVFQQLGTLSSLNKENKLILPLFGKQEQKDRWTYYTLTSGEQQLRIDIEHNNRSCMNDRIGCDMLYNNDIVKIPSYDDEFKVSLYKYAPPF